MADESLGKALSGLVDALSVSSAGSTSSTNLGSKRSSQKSLRISLSSVVNHIYDPDQPSSVTAAPSVSTPQLSSRSLKVTPVSEAALSTAHTSSLGIIPEEPKSVHSVIVEKIGPIDISSPSDLAKSLTYSKQSRVTIPIPSNLITNGSQTISTPLFHNESQTGSFSTITDISPLKETPDHDSASALIPAVEEDDGDIGEADDLVSPGGSPLAITNEQSESKILSSTKRSISEVVENAEIEDDAGIQSNAGIEPSGSRRISKQSLQKKSGISGSALNDSKLIYSASVVPSGSKFLSDKSLQKSGISGSQFNEEGSQMKSNVGMDPSGSKQLSSKSLQNKSGTSGNQFDDEGSTIESHVGIEPSGSKYMSNKSLQNKSGTSGNQFDDEGSPIEFEVGIEPSGSKYMSNKSLQNKSGTSGNQFDDEGSTIESNVGIEPSGSKYMSNKSLQNKSGMSGSQFNNENKSGISGSQFKYDGSQVKSNVGIDPSGSKNISNKSLQNKSGISGSQFNNEGSQIKSNAGIDPSGTRRSFQNASNIGGSALIDESQIIPEKSLSKPLGSSSSSKRRSGQSIKSSTGQMSKSNASKNLKSRASIASQEKVSSKQESELLLRPSGVSFHSKLPSKASIPPSSPKTSRTSISQQDHTSREKPELSYPELPPGYKSIEDRPPIWPCYPCCQLPVRACNNYCPAPGTSFSQACAGSCQNHEEAEKSGDQTISTIFCRAPDDYCCGGGAPGCYVPSGSNCAKTSCEQYSSVRTLELNVPCPGGCEKDDDEYFIQTFLPYVKCLEGEKKLRLRVEIQNLVYKFMIAYPPPPAPPLKPTELSSYSVTSPKGSKLASKTKPGKDKPKKRADLTKNNRNKSKTKKAKEELEEEAPPPRVSQESAAQMVERYSRLYVPTKPIQMQDEDEVFYYGLIPFFKEQSNDKKLQLRMLFMEMLYSIVYGAMSRIQVRAKWVSGQTIGLDDDRGGINKFGDGLLTPEFSRKSIDIDIGEGTCFKPCDPYFRRARCFCLEKMIHPGRSVYYRSHSNDSSDSDVSDDSQSSSKVKIRKRKQKPEEPNIKKSLRNESPKTRKTNKKMEGVKNMRNDLPQKKTTIPKKTEGSTPSLKSEGSSRRSYSPPRIPSKPKSISQTSKKSASKDDNVNRILSLLKSDELAGRGSSKDDSIIGLGEDTASSSSEFELKTRDIFRPERRKPKSGSKSSWVSGQSELKSDETTSSNGYDVLSTPSEDFAQRSQVHINVIPTGASILRPRRESLQSEKFTPTDDLQRADSLGLSEIQLISTGHSVSSARSRNSRSSNRNEESDMSITARNNMELIPSNLEPIQEESSTNVEEIYKSDSFLKKSSRSSLEDGGSETSKKSISNIFIRVSEKSFDKPSKTIEIGVESSPNMDEPEKSKTIGSNLQTIEEEPSSSLSSFQSTQLADEFNKSDISSKKISSGSSVLRSGNRVSSISVEISSQNYDEPVKTSTVGMGSSHEVVKNVDLDDVAYTPEEIQRANKYVIEDMPTNPMHSNLEVIPEESPSSVSTVKSTQSAVKNPSGSNIAIRISQNSLKEPNKILEINVGSSHDIEQSDVSSRSYSGLGTEDILSSIILHNDGSSTSGSRDSSVQSSQTKMSRNFPQQYIPSSSLDAGRSSQTHQTQESNGRSFKLEVKATDEEDSASSITLRSILKEPRQSKVSPRISVTWSEKLEDKDVNYMATRPRRPSDLNNTKRFLLGLSEIDKTKELGMNSVKPSSKYIIFPPDSDDTTHSSATMDLFGMIWNNFDRSAMESTKKFENMVSQGMQTDASQSEESSEIAHLDYEIIDSQDGNSLAQTVDSNLSDADRSKQALEDFANLRMSLSEFLRLFNMQKRPKRKDIRNS